MKNLSQNNLFKAVTIIAGIGGGFASIVYGLNLWGYGHADKIAYLIMAAGFVSCGFAISYLWELLEDQAND